MLITFPELLIMVIISVAGILNSAPSAVVVVQKWRGRRDRFSVVCAQFQFRCSFSLLRVLPSCRPD